VLWQSADRERDPDRRRRSFRYLHCSLCGAEWHHVRIKCCNCDSTRGIHYEELARRDGAEAAGSGARAGAVRAECCDTCGHYIKHLVMEKDPQLDPVADDLASVALDLLVSEAGFLPMGVNLMLCFGEADP
jgi:FdhE protein